MKITNKESLIENYKFLIEKEQRLVKNNDSEIKLDLIFDLIEYLENDEFLDSLIIDEHKEEIELSIFNDNYLLNCKKEFLWFYRKSMKCNHIQENIEEFFKIEVQGKSINEMISNILKDLYEIKFYCIEPLYDMRTEIFNYNLHLFKNTISLNNMATDFKKKHDKIYKNILNLKSVGSLPSSLGMESKGFDKTTKLDFDFFDSCLCNERYPDLNKEFSRKILEMDDLEVYIKALCIFFKDNLKELGILSEDQLYRHYTLIKNFEKEFFNGCKLEISNIFLFKEPIEVQFVTDMKHPHKFLSFNISINASFDDIKNECLYDSSNRNISDLKVKDWLENENEVKEFIRLLNY